MTTTRSQVTLTETTEIVTVQLVCEKDEYALVDDCETIRIVARVPGTFYVYETLANLGKSTPLLRDLAYHAVHALFNGNAEENNVAEYVRAAK